MYLAFIHIGRYDIKARRHLACVQNGITQLGDWRMETWQLALRARCHVSIRQSPSLCNAILNTCPCLLAIISIEQQIYTFWKFWFCNCQPPGMFLPPAPSYRILDWTSLPLDSFMLDLYPQLHKLGYSPGGVLGFATDCPCGVWCCGFTTHLLYVGPFLEISFKEKHFAYILISCNITLFFASYLK